MKRLNALITRPISRDPQRDESESNVEPWGSHAGSYGHKVWNPGALCLLRLVEQISRVELCGSPEIKILFKWRLQRELFLVKWFWKIPHTGNTWPSCTWVMQDYRFYTRSLYNWSIIWVHIMSRVSKSHGLTVVRPRKILLT